MVLVMKCHERHHAQERYSVFGDKIKAVDIPVVWNMNASKAVNRGESESGISFAYTGRISEAFYSPFYWHGVL